jgi:hypothetical protein
MCRALENFADLEKNEFGIYMQQSTKMTNQALHKSMYQEHLAFSHDLMAIAVEGLHLDDLEELVQSSLPSGEVKSVQDVLLQTKREGVCDRVYDTIHGGRTVYLCNGQCRSSWSEMDHQE